MRVTPKSVIISAYKTLNTIGIKTMLFMLLLIFISMLIIWRASDGFEAASGYLGHNFSDGVRGATINAIGSSLPELLTVMIGLLLFIDKDGFAMGVGTTAGSAIFNGAVIPAAVIITVITIGLATQVNVSKKVILRDGLWLIGCESAFIFLLSKGVMEWWHGLFLNLLYVSYIVFMFSTMSRSERDAHQEDDDEQEESGSRRVALLTLDLQWAMFGNRSLNYGRAWLLLVTAIIVISLACWLLVEAVYMFGDALGIGVYFVAVILAAAATSVPDTILSMKDAKAGEYDDAIANALGSNIFDITICLGLPLMLFGLIYGEAITLLPESQGPVTELRALLLIFTIIAFTIYYFGQSMGKFKAVLLFCLYLAFVGYIVASAYQVTFALEIGKFLQGIIQFII